MNFYSESQLKTFAEDIARTIEVRNYDGGSSSDKRRESTPEEFKTIFNVVYGGMLAMNNAKSTIQAVLDTCEYIGNLFMRDIVNDGQMNGYGTIYCPLKSWAEKSL